MFEGLKDKFTRFTDNVEEEAEQTEESVEQDGVESSDGEENEVNTEGSETKDTSRDVTMTDKVKAAAKGKQVLSESDLEGPLRDLELHLLEHDVEMSVADEILDGVRDRLTGERYSQLTATEDIVTEVLQEVLRNVLKPNEFDFDEYVETADKPVTIVFTGVNGVGKTTTIAKLAKRLMDNDYSVVLANGDTFRDGADEQLGEHAENLDVKMISHGQGGDPAAVLYDAVEYAEANDIDVVLGDTAGRLHTDDDLMAQLEKIDRVVDPELTILADEAVAGQDAIRRAKEFNNAAEIDGTVLTKADADAEGGATISIAHVTGKPILFIGNGQEYDDLVEFYPDTFIDFMFE